ncbi:MAG: hypothetical protein WBB28_24490 [Crinalium sp.]
MTVEINNEINNINDIIKFVENVNKELKERNYPRFKITVEIKVKTYTNDRTTKQIKFVLLEDDRYCDWMRVASGVTWEGFIDDVGDELGDSFLRMTGLQKLTDSLNIPVNYIPQKTESNEKNISDEAEENIDLIDILDIDEDEFDDEDEDEEFDGDKDGDNDKLKNAKYRRYLASRKIERVAKTK